MNKCEASPGWENENLFKWLQSCPLRWLPCPQGCGNIMLELSFPCAQVRNFNLLILGQGLQYFIALAKRSVLIMKNIQYNLNGLNTDGLFPMDDSNSFFSPYKILPIAQENKYLGIFSYFIMELYVLCTH